MKKLSIIFSLLFISVAFTNAQDLTIEESSTVYDDSTIPSYTVYLKPDTKAVKKEFEDFMKDRYDVKLKGMGLFSNKDVLSAEGINFKEISNDRMDFHAKIVEENDMTKMSVFGARGYDVFISPDENVNEYRSMKNVLVSFLNDYLPGYYSEKVEDVRDNLNDLSDEESDLAENIEDNNSDIEKMKEKIKKLEQENIELKDELNSTKEDVASTTKRLKQRESELEEVNEKLRRISNDK